MILWLQFFAEINTRENVVVLTDLYSFILKILFEIHYISTINVNKTAIKKHKERKPVILSRMYSVLYTVIYQEKSDFV
jgi:di/tricarboxylate transporter